MRTALVAGALAVVSSALPAQDPVNSFSVTTRAGAVKFDRSASLETAPFVGLDAEYGVSRYLSIGTAITVSRPNTRAEDFLTTLVFGIGTTGDTTLFLQTGQPVNVVEGALLASLRYPTGRFTPFVSGGVGYYGLFMDPQINRGTSRMTGFAGSVGGGLRVQLTEQAGLQFDVRDAIFTGYERDELNPSDGRNPNIFFLEDFPAPPESKSTVHNLMFSIGFRYVPQGSTGGDQ
ncbi:MAG TPA: outer membrane beta-barrel protein [Gemmatimonadaceae bacterium]|nr:outer membrane beta-barrel protein [Gemmatimonadaceae bacterium]